MRIVLPGMPAGFAQGLAQPQLSGQGVLVDLARLASASKWQRTRRHARAQFHLRNHPDPDDDRQATGLRARLHRRQPLFVARSSSPARSTIPGGPPQYTLLESDPVELNVRPLPTEGQLPGFAGAIGSFAVGPPKLATNVLRVGDPVKLTVTVTNRGEGPLARLVAPPPPKSREWQVFAANNYAPPQVVPAAAAVPLRSVRPARSAEPVPRALSTSTTPSSPSPNGARHAAHSLQLLRPQPPAATLT